MSRILHESTNRALCRFAFVMLCLIPSLVIAGWSWRQRSVAAEKNRARDWADYFSTSWGLRVSVHSAATPHPQRVVFHNAVVQDNENSTTILAFDEATWDRETRTVALPKLKMTAAGLSHLVRWLDLRHLRSSDSEPWQIKVDQLYMIWAAEKGLAFEDVELSFTATQEVSLLTGSASIEGYPKPLTIKVERDRKQAATRLVIGLLEGDSFDKSQLPAPLPCPLFQNLVPQLPQLGSQAWFHGRLVTKLPDDAADAAELSILGVFAQVDGKALAGPDFAGTTTVWVDDFAMVGSRCTRLDVLIRSTSGELHVHPRRFRQNYPSLGEAIRVLYVPGSLPSEAMLPVAGLQVKAELRGDAFQLQATNSKTILQADGDRRIQLERPISIPRDLLPAPLR